MWISQRRESSQARPRSVGQDNSRAFAFSPPVLASSIDDILLPFEPTREASSSSANLDCPRLTSFVTANSTAQTKSSAVRQPRLFTTIGQGSKKDIPGTSGQWPAGLCRQEQVLSPTSKTLHVTTTLTFGNKRSRGPFASAHRLRSPGVAADHEFAYLPSAGGKVVDAMCVSLASTNSLEMVSEADSQNSSVMKSKSCNRWTLMLVLLVSNLYSLTVSNSSSQASTVGLHSDGLIQFAILSVGLLIIELLPLVLIAFISTRQSCLWIQEAGIGACMTVVITLITIHLLDAVKAMIYSITINSSGPETKLVSVDEYRLLADAFRLDPLAEPEIDWTLYLAMLVFCLAIASTITIFHRQLLKSYSLIVVATFFTVSLVFVSKLRDLNENNHATDHQASHWTFAIIISVASQVWSNVSALPFMIGLVGFGNRSGLIESRVWRLFEYLFYFAARCLTVTLQLVYITSSDVDSQTSQWIQLVAVCTMIVVIGAIMSAWRLYPVLSIPVVNNILTAMSGWLRKIALFATIFGFCAIQSLAFVMAVRFVGDANQSASSIFCMLPSSHRDVQSCAISTIPMACALSAAIWVAYSIILAGRRSASCESRSIALLLRRGCFLVLSVVAVSIQIKMIVDMLITALTSPDDQVNIYGPIPLLVMIALQIPASLLLFGVEFFFNRHHY